MIEINLQVGKSALSALEVGGLNFSKINVKWILIAVVYSFVSEVALDKYFERIIATKGEGLTAATEEAKSIQTEIDAYKDIEGKINKIAEEEETLKQRRELIRKRAQNKKNPSNIMEYLSKNIPQDVWIEKLVLQGDGISIEGATLTYKSISVFLENLKSSVFFDKSFEFGGTTTEQDRDTGRRVEKFKISGKIVRYN